MMTFTTHTQTPLTVGCLIDVFSFFKRKKKQEMKQMREKERYRYLCIATKKKRNEIFFD